MTLPGRSRQGCARAARLLSGLAGVLAAVMALSACGSDSGGGGSTPSAPSTTTSGAAGGGGGGGSTVDIKDFKFTPTNLTVPAGTTVTWTFDDSTQHTVTANDNSFMSSALGSGQTFTHTFSAAGTTAYHCSIHPFMTGTIVAK